MFQKTYQLQDNAPPPMIWEEYRGLVLTEWAGVLSDDNQDEKSIQHFFEQHPCMLPGVFGLGLTPSGHYPFPAAAISQPALPGLTRKVPDFMWLATDTGNIYPVLIEIERPSKPWYTLKGKQSDYLTQALGQLAEWKVWFSRPENVPQFTDYYRLPPEWVRSRRIKPLYVLIYGRRKEATISDQLSQKTGHLSRENEYLMTFDRLIPQYDARDFLCVRITNEGYYALSVPPTVCLGPIYAECWSHIRNKEEAVEASPYLETERKKFLLERFSYWDKWARSGSRRFGFDRE